MALTPCLPLSVAVTSMATVGLLSTARVSLPVNSLASKGVPVSVGFDELDEDDEDDVFFAVFDVVLGALLDVVVGACVEVLPVPAVGPGPPSPPHAARARTAEAASVIEILRMVSPRPRKPIRRGACRSRPRR